MFRQVVEFVINGIGMCFNLTKSFVMDRVNGIDITYFHFLVYLIFIPIVIRLINFIKQIQEVEEDEQEKYKKEKRYNK